MLLIMSARTVAEEIALQFGRLPPSFLPLGSQRLFALQAELARGEPCFMTVPDDFDIPDTDRRAIEAAGIQLLPQSQSLRLTEAIGNALTRMQPEGPLRILYGDTLVRMKEDEFFEPDMIAVHETSSNYPWAFVETDDEGNNSFSDEPPQRLDSRSVVCGYYNFADPDLLATACHEDTVVKALRFYDSRRPLTSRHAESWLDFGHLPLYFRSKKDILVKRVFNELVYEDHLLLKRSPDTAKIRAEAHWYEHLPGPLQLHTPRYQGREERDFQAGYALEFVHAPLLSDLDAFGALPLASWLEILQACFEFIGKCHDTHPPEGAPEASEAFAERFFRDVIVDKTRSRLSTFLAQSDLDADTRLTVNGIEYPPLAEVAESLFAMIPPTTPEMVRFWHGDLFYGNMFYDFTAQRVLCIDPRGHLASGELSLWGDLRYDLAKIAHSIVGHYDKVILGRSALTVDEADPHDWDFYVETSADSDAMEDIFFTYVNENFDVGRTELLALTALMFLSMLPLHYDCPERQRHLLATGLRLTAQAEAAS